MHNDGGTIGAQKVRWLGRFGVGGSHGLDWECIIVGVPNLVTSLNQTPIFEWVYG